MAKTSKAEAPKDQNRDEMMKTVGGKTGWAASRAIKEIESKDHVSRNAGSKEKED